MCLLALLDLSADKAWKEAGDPLMGITPIMDWVRRNYDKDYAPNTRETFRRQTMHQFVQGGIARYNPDKPDRSVNSPRAVYQIEPSCLKVLRAVGTDEYRPLLMVYAGERPSLAERYANIREMALVPITVAPGKKVKLSPGGHSELIQAICEEFGPRYVPGGKLIYVGDTGAKWAFFEEELLSDLGVRIDNHGKMPDVVIYYPEKHWLVLAEAVTSHGPVDGKRHAELNVLFGASDAGLVFVSAFPNRRTFTKYSEEISWETEVWIADNPTHLIHYNGARFLGPYR